MPLPSWDILLALAVLVTLPGTVELLLVCSGTVVAALSSNDRAPRVIRQACGPLIVVVPAHNESSGIAATLSSLLAADPASSSASIVVVADNCSDDTAGIARAAGVRVIERRSDTHRGKGYALDFAFRTLLPEDPSAFIVVDADARVSPGFFEAFQRGFAGGAEALQCAYLLNEGSPRREALQELAFACFNFLRPLARNRLGLSCGILGNGFGLRAETLRAVPYQAASIVEDLEYHLDLVSSGKRVDFLPDTVLRSPIPARHEAILSQRARWEGGRLGVAVRLAPRLAVQVFFGKWRLLEPLLELLLLPLGYHALLLALGLLAASLGSGTGSLWVACTAVLCGGVTALLAHLGSAFISGHIGMRHAVSLIEVPSYVLWKLLSMGKIIGAARRKTAWIRTERDIPPGGGDPE